MSSTLIGDQEVIGSALVETATRFMKVVVGLLQCATNVAGRAIFPGIVVNISQYRAPEYVITMIRLGM